MGKTLSIKARLTLLVAMLMALLVLAVFANLTRQSQSAQELAAAYTHEALAPEAAAARADKVRQDYEAALWRNVSITVLALGLCGTIALRLTRSIVAALGQAARLAEAVAAGDLRHRQGEDKRGRDELADLLRALDRMSGGLADLVGQVQAAA
ncbi:HAMP domain-containing protein, partial [Pelomonas sp. KK5]|uniref:HAMP domain-containing protein n=1 Tax=Pelomonas sp. KK5 TaxID=1855730 RepID=UPI00117FAB0E